MRVLANNEHTKKLLRLPACSAASSNWCTKGEKKRGVLITERLSQPHTHTIRMNQSTSFSSNRAVVCKCTVLLSISFPSTSIGRMSARVCDSACVCLFARLEMQIDSLSLTYYLRSFSFIASSGDASLGTVCRGICSQFRFRQIGFKMVR